MWLTDPLDDLLSSKAKVAILRAVCHANAPLGGREIARRAGIWSGPASRALRELSASGVLACSHHGRTNTYELAEADIALVRRLRGLFLAEADRRREAVADLVAEAPEVLSVVLFGSKARKESKPGSDTDLLLVVGNRTDELDERTRGKCLQLGKRHGLALSWQVVELDDLRDWDTTGHEFWRSLLKDGIRLHRASLEGLRRRWLSGTST